VFVLRWLILAVAVAGMGWLIFGVIARQLRRGERAAATEEGASV